MMQLPATNISFILMAFTALLVTGCADMQQGVPQAVPQKEISYSVTAKNYTSLSLVKKSKKALKAGDFDLAESLLERAIRKNPYNGWLWLDLAIVSYERGDYDQTLQLCKKSISLAQNDRDLQKKNQQLMQQAYKKE
ncbi:tetratricopeptide repeat protein [Desulfogranum marinum]|uniref:tetratricopeptide repeat protein n=1 Tax=Desulfogranum marinum TaxID=453220 RepID=UPI001963345E|nr:tetratricopeptide repeat protein [Desulfogranum marinum]MBM9512575.1 tetratricopeptide repeat protein [Desulfogranum marinum]